MILLWAFLTPFTYLFHLFIQFKTYHESAFCSKKITCKKLCHHLKYFEQPHITFIRTFLITFAAEDDQWRATVCWAQAEATEPQIGTVSVWGVEPSVVLSSAFVCACGRLAELSRQFSRPVRRGKVVVGAIASILVPLVVQHCELEFFRFHHFVVHWTWCLFSLLTNQIEYPLLFFCI